MTSSTFDRMLAKERDSLPSNTGNYHELEHGDQKYDGVKNMSDAIDADIADEADRTNLAIQQAEAYHKANTERMSQLAGLVTIAGKFQTWKKARDQISAQYDYTIGTQYTDASTDIEDIPDTSNIPGAAEFNQKEKKTLKEASATNDIVVSATKEAVDKKQITKDQAITTLSTSSTHRDNLSRVEASLRYTEGFPTFVSEAIHIKKELVHPDGTKMPYAMSYMEVLESDNREIKKYLPWLWRDIYNDYHMSDQNAPLVEAMGDNYFKYKAFPGIYKAGSEIQSRLLNRQLTKSLERAKDNIHNDTTTRFLESSKNGSFDGGLDFIFNDFLASREITIDGGKDNEAAWESLYQWYDYAISEKGGLSVEAGQAILDYKIKKRGTDKLVNIDKLDNPHATRFYERASKSLSRAKNLDNQLERADENFTVRGLVNDEIAVIDGENETSGDLTTTTRLNQGLVSIVNKAKEQGFNINMEHPMLDPIKNMMTQADKNESEARDVLDRQIQNGDALSDELFQHIPRSGAKRNRDFYEQKGRDLGTTGITPQKMNKLRPQIATVLSQVEPNIDSFKGQLMLGRAEDFYENAYSAAVQAFQQQGMSGAKLMRNAHAQAEGALKAEVEKIKKNKDYVGPINNPNASQTPQKELNNTKQINQYILKNGQAAADMPEYWPGESNEFFEEYEDWVEGGKKGPPPTRNFYKVFSPLIKMDTEDLTARRYEATRPLRESNGEEKKKIDHSDSFPATKKVEGLTEAVCKQDESFYAHLVINPDNLNNMLDDLVLDGSDVNTVRQPARTTFAKGREEENLNVPTPEGKPLSSMTINEVLGMANDDGNEDLRFGLYDIKSETLLEMLDEGILKHDALFDEEAQREIVYRSILKRAHSRSDNKSWNKTYRRFSWLENDEKTRFRQIITALTGMEQWEDDPYSSIELLSPSCAKALIGQAMGQDIPEE